MNEIAAGIVDIVKAGGTPVALLVGAIVGLGLVVIVLARVSGLFASSRTDLQTTAFQDKLLATIDRMIATEEALRGRLETMSRENASLRDQEAELRATISLVRNQRRRLIELLRDLKDGKPVTIERMAA